MVELGYFGLRIRLCALDSNLPRGRRNACSDVKETCSKWLTDFMRPNDSEAAGYTGGSCRVDKQN